MLKTRLPVLGAFFVKALSILAKVKFHKHILFFGFFFVLLKTSKIGDGVEPKSVPNLAQLCCEILIFVFLAHFSYLSKISNYLTYFARADQRCWRYRRARMFRTVRPRVSNPLGQSRSTPRE